MALANLPMVPNVIPPQERPGAGPQQPLASIHYMVPPAIDPKTNGRFGQIEVLAGSGPTSLYYRVFGRGKEGGRASSAPPGRSTKGKPIVAFGGNANMPMTITFQVDEYLPAGVEKEICEPIVLPKGQMDNGIAACRAEMTVGGETKEIWLRRSVSARPARAARSSPSATAPTRSPTTSTASRWASSSSSTTSTSASSPAPSRRPSS